MNRNRIAVLTMILLLSLTAGCSDNQLAKVTKTVHVAVTATGELQKTVILANQQGLLPDDNTKQILLACEKVNAAAKQVNITLDTIKELDAKSRNDLLAVLIPVSQALDVKQLEFIASIKNEDTKRKIEAAVLVIRSAISSTQLILLTAKE